MEEKYSLELFHLLEKEEKTRRSLEQISSANQYKVAKRSIKKLLGREEILMIDVTPSLLRDYEAEARKNNLSSTTINMYL